MTNLDNELDSTKIGRKIQVRQGLSTEFDDSQLDVGEIGFLTDTNDVRIGKIDGTTMSINNGTSTGGGISIADIPNATATQRGLMTTPQVLKLNGISSGANFTFVENVLNSTSTENALSTAMGKKLKDDADALELRVQTIETNGAGSTVTLNNTVTSTSTSQAATANVVRVVNESIESHKDNIASTLELGHVRVGNNVDIVPNGTISVKNASTVNKGVVQLVNDLVTNDASKAATAKTVYELKQLLDNAIVSGGGNVTNVVNNLDSTSGTDALSAGMGNVIKQELDNKASQSELDELDDFVRQNVVTNGIPVTQNEKDSWNSKSNFDGNYANLTNKPLIPTIVDGTTSTSTSEASSANTARVLKDDINDVLEQLNTHSTDLEAHISPTERSNWNNKANNTLATSTSSGLMSATDKVELDSVSDKLSILTNEVAEIDNNLTEVDNRLTEQLEQSQYADTRNTTSPPSFYRAKGNGKHREFKYAVDVGLTWEDAGGEFVIVETIVSWIDTTANRITQYIYGDSSQIYVRKGSADDSSWGDAASINGVGSKFTLYTSTQAQGIPSGTETALVYQTRLVVDGDASTALDADGRIIVNEPGVYEINSHIEFASSDATFVQGDLTDARMRVPAVNGGYETSVALSTRVVNFKVGSKIMISAAHNASTNASVLKTVTIIAKVG